MITEANRIAVATSAVNLLRVAEQFSAFMMAGGSTVNPGATEELALWARVTGRQFDAEFQKLAEELGYAVNRIPEAPKVPDGWQLVPSDLTADMRDALMHVRMEIGSTLRDNADEIYNALLSDAPTYGGDAS